MTLIHVPSHALGATARARDGGLLTEVTASISKQAHVEVVDEGQVQKLALDMGLTLRRVAGNVYEAPASRDYWAVRNGKLVRLTGGETIVDDGEHLDPADVADPETSLNRILADLEF